MITISGSGLSVADIAAVARGAEVAISREPAVLRRVHESRRRIEEGVAKGEQIYGVTTLYGDMANQYISGEQVSELQKIALWHHKTATGARLPAGDVRAAMLLRANAFMAGVSGIRLEIIERFATFLNAGAIPHVYELGSIGASGDLVPLSYIAGAVIGLDPAYMVDFENETLDSHAVLARLGLSPIKVEAKEGLALNNGTSVSTGIAANAADRALDLAALSLGVHALFIQALLGTNQSFDPFIHALKPHPGQVWTAKEMMTLLADSKLIHDESGGSRAHRKGKLIQDRYSLRCLPQYMGPIIDGLAHIISQIEVEANSANDNPLIDPDTGAVYHCGNFLAQYVGVAMDQLRYYVGLLAKHLDVQIALLVSPEFSNGLSPSLVGNTARKINVGFKSMQVVGNSIMPLLGFYGNPIVDRYPTHAEQFNQNINSQAMNSANLARRSVDLFQHYLANALLFAVQAAELRSHAAGGSYDASAFLSPSTRTLYAAARGVADGKPSAERPLVWDDDEAFFQPRVERVLADLGAGAEGRILQSLSALRQSIRRHAA